MAREAVRYVYCGRDVRRWEITDEDVSISLTATALYHLYVTGAVAKHQKTRRVGEIDWKPLSELVEVVERVAYGQLLPTLFEREGVMWCYQGLSEQLQGPFSGDQMAKWFAGGYLHDRLNVFLQTDMLEKPSVENCVSLEELLLYMSQPTFCSEALSMEKPLNDLRQIHCPPGSWGALVGDARDIRSLPLYPPSVPVLCEAPEPNGEEQSRQERISRAQMKIQDALQPALKLFYGESVKWYYLGQREQCTIHGPFDGAYMFSWFQQGWLSLDLLVWSTPEITVSIHPKQFQPLSTLLAHYRLPSVAVLDEELMEIV